MSIVPLGAKIDLLNLEVSMPVITIREGQQTDSGFAATLSIEGRNYPIAIQIPLVSASAEAQWEWYFEQWLQHPTTGIATAATVAESIREYGDRLFEQVFSDRLAFADYARLRDDLGTLRFEIEGSNPEFQALHWEALRDRLRPRKKRLITNPWVGHFGLCSPNMNLWGGIWIFSGLRKHWRGTICCCCRGWAVRVRQPC